MKVITKYPVYFNSEKVSPKDYYVSAEGEDDSFDYVGGVSCETKKSMDIQECDNNYAYNMSNPATAGNAYNNYKNCIQSALNTYKNCKNKKAKLSSADGMDGYELVMGADGNDYYTNPFGDTYAPFDGFSKEDLESIRGADGEIYFMGADGETFYNAKGQKVKDVLNKIGKGIVSGAKAVGRAIKNVSRKIAEKSKTVIAGIKEKRAKRVSDRKLRHQKTKEGKDVLTEELKPISNEQAKKEDANKVVKVDGQNFKVPEGTNPNIPIVVSTDTNTGEKIVGVDVPTDKVVAVPDNQGNIEYFRQSEESGGLSKNTKTALIVGGAVVGVALIGFLIYRLNKKK